MIGTIKIKARVALAQLSIWISYPIHWAIALFWTFILIPASCVGQYRWAYHKAQRINRWIHTKVPFVKSRVMNQLHINQWRL